MDVYKTGGLGAGLVIGFLAGGPIGAAIGAVAGYIGGGAVEAHKLAALIKKVNTAITLTSTDQAVTVKAGGTIGVVPPTGGSILTITPGAVLPATFSVSLAPNGTQAIMLVNLAGSAVIQWKDPQGNQQSTNLGIVTTP